MTAYKRRHFANTTEGQCTVALWVHDFDSPTYGPADPYTPIPTAFGLAAQKPYRVLPSSSLIGRRQHLVPRYRSAASVAPAGGWHDIK